MPRPRTRLGVESLEARTTPAFGLDPSFGSAGTLMTTTDDGPGGTVAVQDDGRIVVLGVRYNTDYDHWLELRRLNADGSLDGSFGTGGRVAFAHDVNDNFLSTAVALGADGSIAVAANLGTFEALDAAVFRFTSAGVLDAGFGTGGVARFDFPGGAASHATDLAVLGDGRVVVTGSGRYPTSEFAVARLTAAGVLDTSFDGDGFVQFAFDPAVYDGGQTLAQRVAVGPGGKLIVGGTLDHMAFLQQRGSV